MGRPISAYLTSEEAKQFEAFCQKHNYTEYKAFRLAVVRLLKSKAKTFNLP